MIQADGVFGDSLLLDIVVVPTLPDIVTDARIAVLSNEQPGTHAGAITADTVRPDTPAENDIHIMLGTGDPTMDFADDNKHAVLRPGSVYQYQNGWVQKDAFLGVDDAWMLISSGPLFSYSGSFMETSDATYRYIKLTSSGQLYIKSSIAFDACLCAAGGGGSHYGGGCGGQVVNCYGLSLERLISVQIGAGGNGLSMPYTSDNTTSGGDTIFGDLRAVGGERGPAAQPMEPWGGTGSGGGSYSAWTVAAGAGGTNGGNGGNVVYSGVTRYGGTGQGTSTRAFGAGDLFAGGGGGSSNAITAGGAGGGGNGGKWSSPTTNGVNGTANTGGGGGGGFYIDTYTVRGGNGGSGIVIIRIPLASIAMGVAA